MNASDPQGRPRERSTPLGAGQAGSGPREGAMAVPEPDELRLRRMRMRACRRGTKEMDLVLGGFARDRLEALEPRELALFDRLLGESDTDLWLWVTMPEKTPPAYAGLLAHIREHAGLGGG